MALKANRFDVMLVNWDIYVCIKLGKVAMLMYCEIKQFVTVVMFMHCDKKHNVKCCNFDIM